RARRTLDQQQGLREHLPLPDARVGHLGDAMRPAAHVHQHRGNILPADPRVYACRAAVERFDLTKKEPADVEDVGADVGQDESVELRQERLVLENGKRRAEGYPRLEYVSDHPIRHQRPDAAQRRLPTEVLVDEQPRAGACREINQLLRLAKGRSQRPLTDNVQSPAERLLRKRAMRVHVGDDVDEVQLLGVEQRLHVVVYAPSEPRAHGFGFRPCAIVKRDECDISRFQPPRDLIAGPESGTQNGETKLHQGEGSISPPQQMQRQLPLETKWLRSEQTPAASSTGLIVGSNASSPARPALIKKTLRRLESSPRGSIITTRELVSANTVRPLTTPLAAGTRNNIGDEHPATVAWPRAAR